MGVVTHVAAGGRAIADLIDALGSERFGAQLLIYLNGTCGADHCAVFQLGRDALDEVASSSLDGTGVAHRQATRYLQHQYWRKDPMMARARSCLVRPEPVVMQVRVSDIDDDDFRQAIYPDVRDRLVVAGNARKAAYSLSILRSDSHESFSARDVMRVGKEAAMLLSLLAKHADMVLRRPDFSRVLTSVPDIEDCMVARTVLPRREVEVCSRILNGLSTAGIALELQIGAESVKTYRKRAYDRLGIGSERELLTWYLALWGTSCTATSACAVPRRGTDSATALSYL